MLRAGNIEGAGDLVNAVREEEGDEFFSGAVETTSTLRRCIEGLGTIARDLAEKLLEHTRQGLERAQLISDPEQHRSYLEQVDSHSRAMRER
jgi:hypothetical protein